MERDPALDHVGRRTKDRPDIVHELSEAADRIVAARVVTVMQREGKLSLLGKMKALTESAEDFNKETETVLDGISDKIAAAKKKRAVAADKHHGYYDGLIKGIEDSVVVIDRLSNGPLGEDGEH
jgi:hypothetical protein